MPPSGTIVVRYSYDAWGNILSITGTLANSLGKNNPFRYRSYYYDNETGWYYLKSRYYDPSICRFISPDSLLQVGKGAIGINLYAYCGNNPVKRLDSDGTFWKEAGEAILKGLEKFGEAVDKAFQIELGFGTGFGSTKSIGLLEVQVSAYQDGLTFGYRNGKEFTSIKGSAGIQVGGDMGISTQYEHRFETDYKADFDEHITTSMPWKVYSCPKTVKDPCILGFPVGSKVQGELSPGLFLGYSSEFHFILGYHFSVGFDVTEFFRILGE